jgi:CelD/BcsL family acetyltransferase involved in cellulose biosynthesis
MEIKIFNDFSEIDPQAWDALVDRNETNVPFLKYGYLKSWWEFKGGGEWPEDSRLLIIVGYEDGRLLAVAPLFIPSGDPQNNIHLLGSVEISDYLDLICLPENKKEFMSVLFEYILENMGEVKKVEWINIPEGSSTISIIKNLVEKSGWKALIEPAYHAPEIRLPQDWDSYLAGIDRKQRHEIRRKMRRADENSNTTKWYIVSRREKLDSEIGSLFSMMEMDDDKKNFLTPNMRAQMADIMHWAFDQGILQLSFLQIDGGKAAAYLCFDYNDHLLVYNSGFDFKYSEYSPGWVLLSYLVRHAIETGKTHFDFMRGDETYKYRFGAEDRFVMKVQLTRV